MKKALLFFFGLLLVHNLYSQKFGYVDTNFILSKMPEYNQAQSEIDKLSLAWQDEIQEMYKELEAMYSSLQAEDVLLTKEMKEDRQALIQKRENEIKEYQKKVFGFEGLFFLKKKELVKPVQDKVFEAVGKVAKDHRLQFVFDKSGEMVMIYTDPVHDYTDYVLESLGLGDPNDVISEN